MKKVVIGKSNSFATEFVERLCQRAGLSVVGKATYWQEVVKMAEETDADIVILGDYLPMRRDGARAALLNKKKREEANWIARNVEYIELTLEKDFQDQFVAALPIPHMEDQFPHLKGIVSDEILNQE